MPPVLVARHEQGAEPAIQRADAPANDLVGAPIQPLQPGVMPDLRGLSAREALRTLTKVGATARMTGGGVVIEQAPAAGEAARRRRSRRAHGSDAPAGGHACRGTAAMTLGVLLQEFADRSGVAAPPLAALGRHAGVVDRLRLAQGACGLGLRGAARRARRRRRVRARSHRPRRDRGVVRVGGAGRRLGAVAAGARRASRARGAVRDLPRRSERAADPRRHHRHQRQDDDDVSARLDLRGRRHPVRPDRHCRLPRRPQGSRGGAHDARSSGAAGDAARDGRIRAAAPA